VLTGYPIKIQMSHYNYPISIDDVELIQIGGNCKFIYSVQRIVIRLLLTLLEFYNYGEHVSEIFNIPATS